MKTTSLDSAGAVIDVVLGIQPCVPANPVIGLSPVESQWVPAGTSVNYTVTVTNKNSTSCNAEQFNLSAAVPSGWTGTFSSGALTLAPGGSGSATLTVKSPTSAGAGYYDLSATAAEASATTYTATASATYVIDNSTPNQAPVAVNDNATTPPATPVTIAVLGNDYDPDANTISVVTATKPAKGSVKINADGTITYTPGKAFKTADTFSYTISDGKLSAKATVMIKAQQAAPKVAVSN
jgi:hypothetical protein